MVEKSIFKEVPSWIFNELVEKIKKKKASQEFVFIIIEMNLMVIW